MLTNEAEWNAPWINHGCYDVHADVHTEKKELAPEIIGNFDKLNLGK
jgi:hypothetical protein